MLNRFLAWWVRQLAGLLPAAWRDPEAAGAATVVSLGFAGEAVAEAAIAISSRRGEEVLCRAGLDESGIAVARAVLVRRRRPALTVLRLPGAALLEREVALPLAAEWDPLAVVGNDLDRLTPFRAEELVWTAEIIRRERAQGRLLLRLSFVPRALFAGCLPALARIGLVPGQLEVALADDRGAGGKSERGAYLRLALNARDGAGREGRRLRLAAAFVGVLAIAAVVLPFARQSLAEWAVSARIEALRPEVTEVLALRGRIGSAADGENAISALRAQSGDPLQVLATLTHILPDDTWLESFTLSHRQLAITGRSARAARLIGLIAADPVLRDPAFTAPVTRAPEGGDEFSIHAELAP